MSDSFLFDDQLDITPLSDQRVAIIGYGSQGRSHALNLRDSGIDVVVGQRAGTGFQHAIQDGFEPITINEAAALGDVVALLLPDELHHPVFCEQIRPALNEGDILLTCHGFSFHYGLVKPNESNPGVLVAPKGAGHRVRSAFLEGSGVPCLVGAVEPRNEKAIAIGLAYAKALGGGRSGVMMTTIAEETETDLFGEQAVLCGGVSALVKAGFETLVSAGYQPEVAYFECVHELKLVVDLLHQGGLGFMRDHISNTAEFGDYTRGPTIIDEHVKDSMKRVLDQIQSGQFANEWLEENKTGKERFDALREKEKQMLIEQVGQRIVALGKKNQA